MKNQLVWLMLSAILLGIGIFTYCYETTVYVPWLTPPTYKVHPLRESGMPLLIVGFISLISSIVVVIANYHSQLRKREEFTR